MSFLSRVEIIDQDLRSKTVPRNFPLRGSCISHHRVLHLGCGRTSAFAWERENTRIVCAMLVHLALSVHGLVTVDTLPKSFDRPAFQSYWDTMPGTVGRRYAQFATAIAPLQVEAVRLFAAGKLRRDDATFAEMSRETLEQLGPTFIKIGQIISVREDILGPVWAAELSKL